MNLRDMLIRRFGQRRTAYSGPGGRICIGTVRCVDMDYGPGIYEGDILEQMLTNDIQRHLITLNAMWPWIQRLDEPRRAAFMSLMFSPGPDWLNSGPPAGMQAAQAGRWEEVAVALLSSFWANDNMRNKADALLLAKQLRTGEWV
jgi:hypothetical protein